MSLRKRIAGLACATILAGVISTAANASDYPTKTIKLVAPFAAGGSSDALARIVAPELSKRLGQPIVIENRAGAGGTIGIASVTQADPDGYTLGVASPGSIVVAVSMMKSLPYDPVKDLRPIGLIAELPIVMVMNSAIPATTIRDVIELEKKKPGSLSFASAGVGTTMHLSGELMNSMTGMKMVHVAYKGAGPAVTGILSGEVGLGFLDLPSVAGQVAAKTVKIIGVTSKRRTATAPDVPTLAETGVPGYETSGWFGIVAPARTSDAIVARINSELIKVMNMPEVRERLLKIGIEPTTSTPEEFENFIKAEIPKTAAVIKAAGIKAD